MNNNEYAPGLAPCIDRNTDTPLTKADIKRVKDKVKKAKDPLESAWWSALLEGVKSSPWYYDTPDQPSLYKDRWLAVAAVAITIIGRHHPLQEAAFEQLCGMSGQLPRTFATLPSGIQRMVRIWSVRAQLQCPDFEFNLSQAECDEINAWRRECLLRRI